MAQTSGFFNSRLDSQGNFDRVYLAEQFASYFSNFIGNGVFAHLLDKFVVTAGTGLSVNVGTGKAFCKGYWFESDANETLSIDLPDGLLRASPSWTHACESATEATDKPLEMICSRRLAKCCVPPICD